ncbi:MAG: 2-dehydro-3-deoxyphosphooctonate aldolase [Bacteroidota bacterium]
MRKAIYIGLLGLLISCSTNKEVVKTNLRNDQMFELTEISTDPTYGLSEKNPVLVGGVDKGEGPLNERRFLNALAGPNGESISYYRSRSCCPIKSDKAIFGNSILLDNYFVTWEGTTDTVSIFINMYDYGTLKAPVGFTIKN